MPLLDELSRLRAQELERIPRGVREITERAMQQLARTGGTKGALQEGDRAPGFSLESLDGRIIRLSDLLARGPVMLNFFRGGWCPFCSLELRAYQRLIESIENVGASLVAISPETHAYLRSAAEQNQLSFPVLSDANNRVAESFGLVYVVPEALRSIYEGFGLDLPERNGDPSFRLPIPATYLVDPAGIIRRAFVDLDHTCRGEPQAFLEGVRELQGSP